MNWIAIDDCGITIAGHEVEIEVRASGAFTPAVKGATDGYQQIEPDEPASFEIDSVEFMVAETAVKVGDGESCNAWRSFPDVLLTPKVEAAIVRQCIERHHENACASEYAAEARQ